jgi:ABC-type phosphonate transport system ATPase subunit
VSDEPAAARREYDQVKANLAEDIQRVTALLDRIDDGVRDLRGKLQQYTRELEQLDRLFLMMGGQSS